MRQGIAAAVLLASVMSQAWAEDLTKALQEERIQKMRDEAAMKGLMCTEQHLRWILQNTRERDRDKIREMLVYGTQVQGYGLNGQPIGKFGAGICEKVVVRGPRGPAWYEFSEDERAGMANDALESRFGPAPGESIVDRVFSAGKKEPPKEPPPAPRTSYKPMPVEPAGNSESGGYRTGTWSLPRN